PACALSVDDDVLTGDLDDPAAHRPGRGPQPHQPALGTPEVTRRRQRSAHPGSGDLQGVGAADDVDLVQCGGDLPGHVREGVGADAAGAVGQVDDDPDDAAAAGRPDGHVLEEEAGVGDDRLEDGAQRGCD